MPGVVKLRWCVFPSYWPSVLVQVLPSVYLPELLTCLYSVQESGSLARGTSVFDTVPCTSLVFETFIIVCSCIKFYKCFANNHLNGRYCYSSEAKGRWADWGSCWFWFMGLGRNLQQTQLINYLITCILAYSPPTGFTVSNTTLCFKGYSGK